MALSYASFGAVLLAVLWGLPSTAASQVVEPEWPPTPPAVSVERMPTGLRIVHLPRVPGDTERGVGMGPDVDISFGFTVPVPLDIDQRRSHDMVRSWLFSSIPARSVELIAHLSGGTFEATDPGSLTGIRIRVPSGQVGPVLEFAAAFLDQRLGQGALLDYVAGLREDESGRDLPDAPETASGIVSSVLLGRNVPSVVSSGVGHDGAVPDAGTIQTYFRANFGTDRAWVILSKPLAETDLEPLRRVRARVSREVSAPSPADAPIGDLPPITLDSRPEGGLVIGSRISSVYYEGWFNTLVVDRAARRVLGPRARFSFEPSRETGVHLIEAPVRLPDYPGDVTNRIWEELVGLETAELQPTRLVEVKQDTLAYLARRSVLEWFAAEDLWLPLEDGWSRVWNLTESEFKGSVSAFLREPRVRATWSPSFDAPAVVVGGLGEIVEAGASITPLRIAPGAIDVGALGLPPATTRDPVRVERLSSGVGLTPGSPAVFISGPPPDALSGDEVEIGPNGALWRFPGPPDAAALAALAQIRPDRLLFLLPPGVVPDLRETLETWTGSRVDATASMSVGEFSTIDLPALIILKVWIERRVIEAGWSGRVEVRIRGTEGSKLVVDASPLYQEEVASWLASAADWFGGANGEVEFEFEQLHAAAAAYFDQIRSDLAILLWQRAPAGEVPSPDTITLERFLNVVEVYF